jgi:hypothetical protein
VIGDVLYIPQNEKVEVYDLMGSLVKVSMKEQRLSLTELKEGVYVIKVILDKEGNIVTGKVLR